MNKKLLGFVLVCMLVLSTFVSPTFAQYIEQFDPIIETIEAFKQETVTVTVDHLDTKTLEMIAPTDEIPEQAINSVLIGKEYQKEIIGYEFSHASPEILQVGEQSHHIQIFYNEMPQPQIGHVIIKHMQLDEQGNQTAIPLQPDTELSLNIGKVVNGKEYAVAHEDYTFSYSEPEQVTVSNEPQILTLWYEPNIAEEIEVTFKYVDELGNALLDEKRMMYRVGSSIQSGDHYELIDGYELQTITPQILVVGKDEPVMTYVYRKLEEVQFNVTISYQDINGTALSDNVELIVTGGTELNYSQYLKTIDGYTFNHAKPETVTVVKDETMTLYYTKDEIVPPAVDVTIHHSVEGTTEPMFESETLKNITLGTVIQAKDYVKNHDLYVSANPLELIVSPDNNEITIYYAKPSTPTTHITLRYIEKSTTEVLKEIVLKEIEIGKQLNFEDYLLTFEEYNFMDAQPEILTVSETENTITFNYVKEVKPRVDVHVEHLNKLTNEEIHDTSILEQLEVGTNVVAEHFAKTLENFKFMEAKPELLTVSEKDKLIQLYYMPTTNVTIYHKSDSGEQIKEPTIIEDTLYHEELNAIDYVSEISGYEYVKAEPETLLVNGESKEMTIYYKETEVKEETTDVTIHHKLENGEEISEATIVKAVKYGEVLKAVDYTVELVGYDYIKADPEMLIVNETSKEMTIYYKKTEVSDVTTDVTIHHKLENGEEISEATIVKAVKYGEELKAVDYIVELEGYKYIKADPEMLIVNETSKEMTIYYKEIEVKEETTDVIIYHKLENGKEISNPTIIKDILVGQIITGANYALKLEGYEFLNANPTVLEVTEDNNEIILNYRVNDMNLGGNGNTSEPDKPETGLDRIDYLIIGCAFICGGLLLKLYHQQQERRK